MRKTEEEEVRFGCELWTDPSLAFYFLDASEDLKDLDDFLGVGLTFHFAALHPGALARRRARVKFCAAGWIHG